MTDSTLVNYNIPNPEQHFDNSSACLVQSLCERRTRMNDIFLNLLAATVEKHGCRIVDMDIENHTINLDGPEENVHACAEAIANLVGD